MNDRTHRLLTQKRSFSGLKNKPKNPFANHYYEIFANKNISQIVAPSIQTKQSKPLDHIYKQQPPKFKFKINQLP